MLKTFSVDVLLARNVLFSIGLGNKTFIVIEFSVSNVHFLKLLQNALDEIRKFLKKKDYLCTLFLSVPHFLSLYCFRFQLYRRAHLHRLSTTRHLHSLLFLDHYALMDQLIESIYRSIHRFFRSFDFRLCPARISAFSTLAVKPIV